MQAATGEGGSPDPRVADAWELLDRDELRDLVCGLVAIPSPTGEERPIAEFAADWLEARGVDATVQGLDTTQANTVAALPGSVDGRSLLLYAPLDTVTVGAADEDVPGVGDILRADLRCTPEVVGSTVRGLGASNPKGHAAACMAAAAAIARSDVPLTGPLHIGLGAGGMPTNRRPGATRSNAGQGVGCSFMIEQGLHPDAAIIAKPGWVVAWEEVGLCWFRVTVHGTYNYVGSRHRLPYRNAIVDAGRLVDALDDWFLDYAAQHRSGLVEPQGQIGWIGAGWERMPAFSPATCSFLVDLRISPRTSPQQARRAFLGALEQISADLGIQATGTMVLGIPGTSTDPDHWIVSTTTRAWERVAGRTHELAGSHRTTSGATDANILRARGIPTARVGMDRIRDDAGDEVDFALGMNAVDLDQLDALARVLIGATVEVCGDPLEAA